MPSWYPVARGDRRPELERRASLRRRRVVLGEVPRPVFLWCGCLRSLCRPGGFGVLPLYPVSVPARCAFSVGRDLSQARCAFRARCRSSPLLPLRDPDIGPQTAVQAQLPEVPVAHCGRRSAHVSGFRAALRSRISPPRPTGFRRHLSHVLRCSGHRCRRRQAEVPRAQGKLTLVEGGRRRPALISAEDR
jgi:hypothetical protein